MFARSHREQGLHVWIAAFGTSCLCVLSTACTPVGDWLEGLGVEDETGTEGESGGDEDSAIDSDDDLSDEDEASVIDELPDDEDAIELNCVNTQKADFCWYEFARSARDCLSDSMATGRFDAGRKTCSFSDGEEVRFSASVPEPEVGVDEFAWNFRVIDADGDTCLTVRDDSEMYDGWSLQLSVGADDAEIMRVGGATRIQCPNGDVYRSESDEWLGDCPELAPKFRAWSIESDQSTVFELSAQPDPARIFECVSG